MQIIFASVVGALPTSPELVDGNLQFCISSDMAAK